MTKKSQYQSVVSRVAKMYNKVQAEHEKARTEAPQKRHDEIKRQLTESLKVTPKRPRGPYD